MGHVHGKSRGTSASPASPLSQSCHRNLSLANASCLHLPLLHLFFFLRRIAFRHHTRQNEVSQLFGRHLRELAFSFDPDYTPLNHGSYGAYPKVVRDKQRELQDQIEARSDPFIRKTVPKLLRESREAIAPLLGASPEEVVYVPNATTAINTVLRNLSLAKGDVIVYFSTAYPACEKTIQHICETTPVGSYRIDVNLSCSNKEIVQRFHEAVRKLEGKGEKVRVAMFDTVATFPDISFPWKELVAACKQLNVLSLVDGAHGIGDIDLECVGTIGPDFFTSNCYK